MATYEIDGHLLLSDAVLALKPQEIAAEHEVAEAVLGLADTRFRDTEEEWAKIAIVRQMNAQVAMQSVSGASATLLESESKGPHSRTYRSRGDGGSVVVDEMAKRMADRLLRGAWTPVVSLR